MAKPHPRVSVYCPCGAQWHGHYAVANPIIREHARRCGPAIDEDEFRDLGYRVRKPWKDVS